METEEIKNMIELINKFQSTELNSSIKEELIEEGYTLDLYKASTGQTDSKDVLERFNELLNNKIGDSFK